MSIETAPGAAPPAQLRHAGVPEPRRFSLEAIQDSKSGRAVMGVILCLVALGIVYLIFITFLGHFTDVVTVDTTLPAGSNSVPLAAPVEYLNITVGKIASESASKTGQVEVKISFYTSKLKDVPAGVESQVQPLSIFGSQYVDLVAPAHIGTAHLAAHDFIPPYGGSPSVSLQGTITQLYTLLHAINPASLDSTLTAFATALNGEGTHLGQTLTGASTYLKAIVPHLNTVAADLRLTAPVSHELEAVTPTLLSILSNSTTTADTINSESTELRTLLASGAASVGQLANILTQVQSTLPQLINGSGPLLSDITHNPDELSLILKGLGEFAGAVASAESHGPYLEVTANLPVQNISAGVNAALGYDNPASITEALGSTVNPPTYTSANCPQYTGESNPYCDSGSNSYATPSGSSYLADLSAAGSPGESAAFAPATAAANAAADDGFPFADEMQAAQAIATALNGGQAPAAPGTADLLLWPLLASVAGS